MLVNRMMDYVVVDDEESNGHLEWQMLNASCTFPSFMSINNVQECLFSFAQQLYSQETDCNSICISIFSYFHSHFMILSPDSPMRLSQDRAELIQNVSFLMVDNKLYVPRRERTLSARNTCKLAIYS